MTFWTLIIAGVISMLTGLVTNNFQVHQTIGLVQKVVDIAASSLGLAFTIGFSTFDMTVPYLVFGLIMAAEVVRYIYSGWRWIKGLLI